MEDEIHLVLRQKDKVGNVVFDEMEILVPGQMGNVGHVARDEIIDRDYSVAFGQKSVSQMRSEESGTASDNRDGLFCAVGHFGFS